MAGRLPVACLLALVVAAIAAPPPVTAAAYSPLLIPPAPPAPPAPAASPAPAPPAAPAAVPPAAPAPAPAATPAPPTTPAPLPEPALDSGEYGVEYQLSVHDAESFLDRLSARWKRLVQQAMTYLGTPYRRGGTSRRGLDCSGLVGAVYGQEGMGVPRTAVEQFGEGAPVAERDLRPGDLVFFRDTYKRGISHVGIYIGDGRFVHAAGRLRGVVVSELSRSYYRLRYAGARRLTFEPPATESAASERAPDAERSGLTDRPAAASALEAAPAIPLATSDPATPLAASEPATPLAASSSATPAGRPDGL